MIFLVYNVSLYPEGRHVNELSNIPLYRSKVQVKSLFRSTLQAKLCCAYLDRLGLKHGGHHITCRCLVYSSELPSARYELNNKFSSLIKAETLSLVHSLSLPLCLSPTQ